MEVHFIFIILPFATVYVQVNTAVYFFGFHGIRLLPLF